jgi:predicted nucleic acid-binding protein
MIIVDASVAVKWVADEPDGQAAVALLEQPLAAPVLWLAEAANALWRKCRQGDIDEVEARDACRAFLRAPVEPIALPTLLPSAVQLALRLAHPVYDCFYLAAAELHDTHLVTADRRLVASVARHPDVSSRVRLLASR